MNKILTIEQAIEVSQKFKNQKKQIVLVGGVFDILHKGHIVFLKAAKKQGDILFILLESDKAVRKLKGEKRPVNNQEKRATVLSALPYVDYVILMAPLNSNEEYDELVKTLQPDILATTKNDPNIAHKIRQADRMNAEIVEVVNRIPNKSTTNLIEHMK